MTAPTAQEMSYQSIVAVNVGRILQARGLKKKSLADAMNVAPQVIARHLSGRATWSIDDVCNAARFLNVQVDTLLKPSLSAAEVLGYEKTAAPDDSGDGGLNVFDAGQYPGPGGPGYKPLRPHSGIMQWMLAA